MRNRPRRWDRPEETGATPGTPDNRKKTFVEKQVKCKSGLEFSEQGLPDKHITAVGDINAGETEQEVNWSSMLPLQLSHKSKSIPK